MSTNHPYLKRLVYQGAKNKHLAITDDYLDRLNDELALIEKYDFTDYFILCQRIAEVCNELKLIRSYSRACSANLLVCYCLDISKFDPVKENLMAERLIYPNIQSYPDIDIDIPKGYQQMVIEKFKLKHPEYYIYFIALPNDNATSEMVNNRIGHKKHQCAIIFNHQKINEFTFEQAGNQFYAPPDPFADSMSMMRVDLIEQNYLNKIQLLVNEIGEEYNPYKLPLNDPKVLDLFASGDLDNIFQFSTPSLKKILAQFKPNSVHELSIINATFFPGLEKYIPNIIKNKHSGHSNYYWSDIGVHDILKETFDIVVYQETFLRLAKDLAGINFEEGEVWRRKMMRDKTNKKINEFMLYFIDRCFKYSTLDTFEIALLSDIIRDTFQFTFPKAHSLSYTLIGYWGAYYKTYFRKDFDRIFRNENEYHQE